MTGLCDQICRVGGVLGVSAMDREGLIMEESYTAPTAKTTLESIMPSIFDTIRHCEINEPNLENLRLRFQELTLYAKIFKSGFIITLCKNDLIIYMLEAVIDSLVAGAGKPRATADEPCAIEAPPSSAVALAAPPKNVSLGSPLLLEPAPAPEMMMMIPSVRAPEMNPGRMPATWAAEESVPVTNSAMPYRQRPMKREAAAFGFLYDRVLNAMQPYFNNAAAAERLLQRQIRDRLKISADQLNSTHMDMLAVWVATAAGLLVDKGRADELGNKIRKLR